MNRARARCYELSPGRFLGADPLGLRGGMNRYAYAGVNPMNRADPSGMYITSDAGGGGSGAPYIGWAVSVAHHKDPHDRPPERDPSRSGVDCSLEWTIFSIGLALGLIGFGVAAARIRTFAGSILRGVVGGAAAGASLALSVRNLMRNGPTGGSLGDLLNIGWILMKQLILPMLDWWGVISLTAQVVARLAPIFAAITLGVLLPSAVFAAAQLRDMGC